MIRTLLLALAGSTVAQAATAENWRPVAMSSNSVASVEFDSLRGPPTRRIGWVVHSMKATDPVLQFDYLMIRYTVDCEEDTVQRTGANHYRLDGTLVHGSDEVSAVSVIAPGTTDRFLADAICSGQRPERDGYSSAGEATLAIRRMPN